MSVKLKYKDEVIIPTCPFVTCANDVEMGGAKIDIADIDPRTKLMDIDDDLKISTKNKKVIMPVQ